MMIQKVKPYRSKRYLSWIREQPCTHCRAPAPSEAHHMIGIAGGGTMGGKASDVLACPLCSTCHRDLHDGRIDLEAQTVWLARTLEAAFHHGALTEGSA